MHRHRLSLAVATLCVAMIGLSACSSSANSSGGSTDLSASGGSAASGLAAAGVVVKSGSVEPTAIGVSSALPKTPDKGIKVALVTCAVAACQQATDGFRAAAAALGWNATIIAYNPTSPGQAVQQAIDGGNRYIALQTLESDTVKPQLAEAQTKGIKVFTMFSTDTVGNASNGIWGVAGGNQFATLQGHLGANFLVTDSKGTANVAVVTVPTLTTLTGIYTEAQKVFGSECPGCTLGQVPVTLAQLGGGQVPSQVVAYLQSHPKVDYVWATFNDLFPGLVAALKTAGLADRVKIIGGGPTQPSLQSMVAGTSSAWVVVPLVYAGWAVVDWMARDSVGEKISTADLDAGNQLPVWLLNSTSVASEILSKDGGTWPGPNDYAKQFEALWKV